MVIIEKCSRKLQQHSTYCDITKLDIANFLFSSSSEYFPQDSISFGPTIIGVVERCGPYVKELSFGQRWLRISQQVVDCITRYVKKSQSALCKIPKICDFFIFEKFRNCRQIKNLDLGAVILNADINGLLSSISPKLEHFCLEETTWLNSEHASKVIWFFFSKTISDVSKFYPSTLV